MPPLVFHMAFAHRIHEDVGSRLLTEQIGPFLLGATSPDIRVITRWDRDKTHFFDFDTYEHQDSVRRFLAEYPQLTDPGAIEPSTAAFVAGYTTHLTLDQAWITE